MSKELIVSVTPQETKAAILENDQVIEIHIERDKEHGVVGAICKGRVMKVLPGMQSAFVDIGLERDAFLYVSDFFDEEEEFERIVAEKGGKKAPEAEKEAVEHLQKERLVREHQMEAAHEIAEPLAIEAGGGEQKDAVAESVPEDRKGKLGRGRRGKKDEEPGTVAEADPMTAGTMFFIEEDSHERAYELYQDKDDWRSKRGDKKHTGWNGQQSDGDGQ